MSMNSGLSSTGFTTVAWFGNAARLSVSLKKTLPTILDEVLCACGKKLAMRAAFRLVGNRDLVLEPNGRSWRGVAMNASQLRSMIP